MLSRMATGHVAAGASRSRTSGRVCEWNREGGRGRRERDPLGLYYLGCGTDQVFSQNDQSTT